MDIGKELLYLQTTEYNYYEPRALTTLARLASSGCLDPCITNTLYPLTYLYLFSPSYETCEKLLSTHTNFPDLSILKCCVMYGYNSLYLEHSHRYDEELYRIAAKTNNKVAYEHQRSFNKDAPKLPLEFCYSLYLP